MCVCNIDAKVCCTLFAALAEQSSRKRARTEPKTPASLTTHKTSNNGKKKPRRRRSKKKKTVRAQRSCEASHSLFKAIKVPTGKLLRQAADLAHAQTEQLKWV